jgi:hypothetical protein
MPDFHIDKRLGNLPDPQKSFLWELKIPNLNGIVTSIKDTEDLTIRCRSVSIPARGNETIESHFFGMKQKFASKPTFGQTLSVMFEEFEDQLISKALYEWNNKIFDTDRTSAQSGGSKAVMKRNLGGTGYATDLYLYLYKFDKTKLEKSVRFFNAFPQDVSDISLDYAGGDSIKYNVTFSYDYWNLV